MRIFSGHRKKVEAKKRFGSMEFRNKIKAAGNYKRVYLKNEGKSKFSIIRIICVITLFLLIYFLIISDALLIKEVTVRGNTQVSTAQIDEVLSANANSRLFFIKKNHFLLMSEGRVNKLLTKGIPTIKSITTSDRKWPNKITIEIVEHTPGFVIESNGNYFLILAVLWLYSSLICLLFYRNRLEPRNCRI